MPQDSSFQWKSESQFKFLDENPWTNAVLGALSDTIRFFLDLVPSIDKTKGLKSSGYYDGYKDLTPRGQRFFPFHTSKILGSNVI